MEVRGSNSTEPPCRRCRCGPCGRALFGLLSDGLAVSIPHFFLPQSYCLCPHWLSPSRCWHDLLMVSFICDESAPARSFTTQGRIRCLIALCGPLTDVVCAVCCSLCQMSEHVEEG